MNLIDAMKEFMIWLKISINASQKTIEQYSLHIWKLIQYLDNEYTKNLNQKMILLPRNAIDKVLRDEIDKAISKYPWNTDEIDIKIIDGFRYSLSQGDLDIKTVNAYMITLRSFFKFLKKKWIESIDPTLIDLAKNRDRMVSFLDKDEVIRLLSQPDPNTIMWKRDIAIMECIYSTWLRISELVALDISDINLKSMEFPVRWKWGKVRAVFLTLDAKNKIEEYLNSRNDEFAPLFIRHNYDEHNSFKLNSDDVRLTRFFITWMIKDYALKAWIPKDVSAHTLRHSFATTLLENWADIRAIQELLWHRNIVTTQVYTHVTNPKLKEIHKKFHN